MEVGENPRGGSTSSTTFIGKSTQRERVLGRGEGMDMGRARHAQHPAWFALVTIITDLEL